MKKSSRCCVLLFVATMVTLLIPCLTANAGIKVLGVQYTEDQILPEFNCYHHPSSYPTSCPSSVTGATVHVFIQNTNAGSIVITNASLAGYNLDWAIKMQDPDVPDISSIWFRYKWWENPPYALVDAGEPAWFRANPTNLPPGGVGEMAVRLRFIPTNWVNLGVQTTGGNVTTNLTVDANAPRIRSIGYSGDRTKVYLHWWRPGGAAPTSVWVDGTNRTSVTTTVGDTNVEYAVSVISLTNALSRFSYHVYQGVYADGATATAGQRAWTNKFIHGVYCGFETDANYTAEDWVDEATAHGINNCQMNLSDMPSDAYMLSKGYGYTTDDKTKLHTFDPDLWFLNDEPDCEEENKGNNNCGDSGTVPKLPCSGIYYAGLLVHKETKIFASELLAQRPNVPITVNLDGGLHPQSWYTWGRALDVLESNNYYDVRLRDSYWFYPQRIPLYKNAKHSYAVARTASLAAAPNPFVHLLYSCKWKCTNPDYCDTHLDEIWPFPTPQSKRIEAYYSLAGGSKGLVYWWFTGGSPSFGLKRDAEGAPLWKEIGLYGNEIKTARDLIIRSTQISMPIMPNSTNIWARAAASDADTLLVYVANDYYYSDQAGFHYTNVANAILTNTLPSWMVTTNTSAFEITTGGRPADASWTLNGNQFTVYLGTLDLTRLVVITKDPNLRSAIDTRFTMEVKTNLCTFAPEYCYTRPTITLQPVATNLCPGGTVVFKVSAYGSNNLAFQWQKNGISLGNGGHYSGVTTTNLTVSSVDAGDTGNYRCVISCTGGTTNSSAAALTLKAATTITQQPTATNICSGGTATFTIAATGEGTVTYQWQKNGTNISNGGHYSGCTTATLTITGADANDAANYRCVATAVCGASTSFQAALTVGTAITIQPTAQTVCAGANATFSVTASGGGTLTYQWRTNGVNISNNSHYGGCTTATLTVTNAQVADQVNYDVVVTSSCGSATSTAVSLSFGAAPSITVQPTAQTVDSGSTAYMSVTATGYGLTYQWQKNSVNVNNGGHYSGCTTATLTISNADTNDIANYRCVVSGCGSAVSSQAMLKVNTCNPTAGLQDGYMDDTSGWGVAPGWSSYTSGAGTFSKNTSIYQSSPNAQRVMPPSTGTPAYSGIYQNVPATLGDAITFKAYTYNESSSTYIKTHLGAKWDGTTTRPSTFPTTNAANATWTQLTVAGQATTANGVTVFLEAMRGSSGNYYANFDTVDQYRCYLPPAPVVTSAGSTSLYVDMLPGCNSTNSSAQFAITIGGGAYTLGTHWVQTNGSVSTTVVWQTDAAWGIKTVTNLATGTTYTIKVKARYSSSLTQETAQGAGASCAPAATPKPDIIQQPSPQNLCAGANATFSVVASGEGTLTYQWQTNTVNISNNSHYGGATSSTLWVTNVQSADAVNYRCVVSNAGGSTNSSPAALTLKAATTITGQPSAQNVCSGAPANFTVTATGDGTLTYQWQKNQVNLSNGGHYSSVTTATLTITGADGTDTANYRCVVTGGCGSANSSEAALTLKAATAITGQPSAQNVCPGATANFTVTATGDGTLTYQWQKNQANLSNGGHYSGVTTATLTITGADGTDVANYRCVVTGGCGSANSSEAALSLKAATSITSNPSAQNVCPGVNVSFSVTATGDGTVTYQWQTNNVNISNGSHYAGCTAATLWVTNVTSADAVSYRCVVTAGCGSANSTAAAMTVKAATTITTQPVNTSVATSGTTNFTVAATGDGTLTYQWQTNNVNISNGSHYGGCTTATLWVTNCQSGDQVNYRCVVTGGCGSANSSTATLTVGACVPPAGLLNAYFDVSTNAWTVATNWTSYSSGSSAFSKNTTIRQSVPNAQRIRPPTSGTGAYGGVYQKIGANLGDAITFKVWFYNESASQYVKTHLGAKWDGSTTPPATFPTTNINNATWTQLTVAGQASNATNGVTVFLHVIRGTTGTYYVNMDTVDRYHAYVPPAPTVTWASSTSLNVNVDPGCNSANTNAQFAITIGGGAYTLGTHWVQTNGTVSTSVAWQTDAAWGNKTVAGLSTGTTYTFKAKARYSSSLTQETAQGAGATGIP